ncbi:MAG: hypothetical protein P8R43_00055 [Planctomycetota bacterium]|nr:hypothetical protein [Planctomycetota bacterium]
MPDLFLDKTAPSIAVALDGEPATHGCVVDAGFARIHVRFEGPDTPCYGITEAVSLSFCSSSSMARVEAPGRIIERKECDSFRLYVIQVPPEISRRVLQAEGLRNDYRLETARHPEASARLRVKGEEWVPVALKNISISGAAILIAPREEAAIAGYVEAELELTLSEDWVHVLPTRIVQRRLEGGRTNCGMTFEWPATASLVEVERQLRSWIQKEQVRFRTDRLRSA